MSMKYIAHYKYSSIHLGEEMVHDLKYDPIPYLLASRRPAWVKYQTLVKIIGKSEDDPEVIHWREKRDTSAAVARLRAKQAPDGSFPCFPWMHIHKYHFHQMLEMGFGLEDATVRLSAENLLNYQLPDGGYMHPVGHRVNVPDPVVGWAACVTGYVTYALMQLGFKDDHRVAAALNVMLRKQRDNGGWICNTVGENAPYCILSGTPWVFRCLAEAGMIGKRSRITERALEVFSRHKQKIIRHGYQDDHYYRCDETLLLPSLYAIGFTKRHHLIRDFRRSLIEKQQPDGSWLFRRKPSPWYTIEVIQALRDIG
jgi:hypothetical protein